VTIVAGRLRRLCVLTLATATLVGCGFNAIPTKQERGKATWADVQSQYQRRADLIPNLVATVQGFAVQERSVLTEVTQARASATRIKVDASTITDPAAFGRYQSAQNQLSGVLGRLLLLSERYPDLKSSQNFLTLQSQLEGTENRIAIARRDYNEAVRDYNTELRTVPGLLWAKTVYRSSAPMQPFAATTAAQQVPVVKIAPSTPPSPRPQP
jgi:LemA protein